MQTNRMERLAHELQQEIATIIHRELKHPGLGFVTITRVELSKDVRHATVGFSCLGSADEREASHEALDSSRRFIEGLIRKRFRLKIIPELTFRYDTSIEESIALSEKFDRLKSPPAES